MIRNFIEIRCEYEIFSGPIHSNNTYLWNPKEIAVMMLRKKDVINKNPDISPFFPPEIVIPRQRCYRDAKSL